MPSLRMEGPFIFNTETIDEKVDKVSPGNYALGRKNENGIFLIQHIGRANIDLNSKLKSWTSKSQKPLFKFRYAISAKEAFNLECENYHDFEKEGRNKHPRRPAGTDWKCPRCEFYPTTS